MTHPNDKQHYATVARELSEGKIDVGLMAKAFAEANGSKPLSEALYLKMRVSEIRADWLQRAAAFKQIEELEREKIKREQEEKEYQEMGVVGKIGWWLATLFAAAIAVQGLINFASWFS